MCLAVYISTDQHIQTIPWNNDVPSLFITDTNNRDHYKVENQFTLAQVYYIGSHEGCGCGFIFNENDPEYLEEKADLQLRIDSVSKLVSLIESVLSKSASVEIFACYEGSQSEKPNRIGEIEPEALLKHSIFVDAWDKPQFAIIRKKESMDFRQ